MRLTAVQLVAWAGSTYRRTAVALGIKPGQAYQCMVCQTLMNGCELVYTLFLLLYSPYRVVWLRSITFCQDAPLASGEIKGPVGLVQCAVTQDHRHGVFDLGIHK